MNIETWLLALYITSRCILKYHIASEANIQQYVIYACLYEYNSHIVCNIFEYFVIIT